MLAFQPAPATAGAAALQLVISYHMNANIMCEYSREEWVNGFTRMNVDSIDKLRAKLPELRAELRDPTRFQEVYSFAFAWAREVGSVIDCNQAMYPAVPRLPFRPLAMLLFASAQARAVYCCAADALCAAATGQHDWSDVECCYSCRRVLRGFMLTAVAA